MKISDNERVILSLLLDHGASYGLQLIAESEGRLRRGGIYVTLGTMEKKGLVSSAGQSDGRRVYQLTGVGYRALAAMEIVTGVWEQP